MTEVWLHHLRGDGIAFWYVTRDGLSGPRRVREMAVRDVRFVIDPVGQERARRRRRPTTHAWAIGTPFMASGQPEGVVRVRYQWWRSDHFTMEDRPVRGCWQLFVGCEEDGTALAYGAGPIFGDTERRNVQQYGGRD